MMTTNILRYSQLCNVDPQVMVKALQRDPLQREQFEAWKQTNNFVGMEFRDHLNTNEARQAEAQAARQRIRDIAAFGKALINF